MLDSEWQMDWCKRCEQAGLVDYSWHMRIVALEEWTRDTGPRLKIIQSGLGEIRSLLEANVTKISSILTEGWEECPKK